MLPPTLNVTTPNAKFARGRRPLYVNTQAAPLDSRRGGAAAPRRESSAFGFGGTNFHVVLEEYQAEHAEPYRLHRTSREVVVTAPTTVELRTRCAELRAELRGDGAAAVFASIPVPEIPSDWARLGFVADSAEECAALLDTALAQIDADPAADSWQHPKGVFYRRRGMETAGRVVALFPGQGSQHVDMGRTLAMNFPAVRQMIGLFDAESGPSVSSVVYPPPAFTDEQRSAQAETLRRTEYAQPAIGALSAGMYTLLQRAGFTPDFTAGHSFGELTALWAAGVLDNGNFTTLVNARGQAMAATGGDRGTMVAVVGEASAVERDIAACPGVSVANINAPDQVVIAGPSAAVDAAVTILRAKQYTTTPLPVSAAFHTSLVGDAQRPFERAVAECEFRAPQIPVYANVTAAPYPASPSAARALLGEQMLKPVRFRDQVENLHAAGGRIFVEIGPRDVLTNLVKATLGDRPHVALALNPKRDQDSDRQLRRALIQLRVVGVRLGAVDEYGLTPTTGKPARRPRLAVPLNGANYVSEQTRAAYQAAITENPSQPVVGCSTQETAAVPSDLEQKLSELFDRLHEDLAEMRKGQAEMLAALWHLRPEPVAAVERPAEVAPPALVVVPEPAPVVAPVPVVASVPAAPVAGVLVAELTAVLLEVVSENTGYPVDTLELDMDMESDLGIDSIKRVQILAMMRQRFEELPGLAPEELAELRTLGQIVAHLEGKLASAGAASAVAPDPVPEPAPVVAPVPVVASVPAAPVAGVLVAELTAVLLEVVSENTGYPVDTLELDMDMESDLGIDSIKRVQILAMMRQRFEELPGLAPEELAELRTLGQIVAHLEGKLASAGAASAVAPDPVPEPAPVVAPVPVVASVPAAPVAGVLVAELTAVLLEVVSENTGYPVDTLELDMDMESDLGIDSIKRVQILAMMRQRFEELPGLAPEELAELRTLGQIVAHLEGKLASAGAASAVAPDPVPVVAPAPAASAQPFVMESKLRPVPVRLAPLQAPDRLDYKLPESRTIVVTDDGTAAAPAIALALADRGWQPVLLRFPTSLVARTEPLPASLGRLGLNSTDEEELAQALQMIASSYGPISGFLHVHPGSSRSGMFSDADDALLRHVFLTAKHLAVRLGDAAATGHACFVVVSRLDGQLGAGSDPAGATQGGLHGLVKTLLQERPGVHCRAIDIAPSTPTSQLVDMVLAELADPDRRLSVVGYGSAGRVTLVGDFASTNGSH